MENKSNVTAGSPAPGSGSKGSDKSKASIGVAIIVGIILIILVVALLDRFTDVNIVSNLFKSEESRQQAQVEEFLAETGSWHAVFLTNGQVYFGQLDRPEAQYARLTDVYYLQLQQVQQSPTTPPAFDPNSQEGEAQVVDAPQPVPPRLTMIKFGTELHGPVDFMEINRDHILFWEELRSDSQVVQAIVNYKSGQ
jgi:hypothetical protein